MTAADGFQNLVDRSRGDHRRSAEHGQELAQGFHALPGGVRRRPTGSRVDESVEKGPRLGSFDGGEGRSHSSGVDLHEEERFEGPPALFEEPWFELVGSQLGTHLLDGVGGKPVGRSRRLALAAGFLGKPELALQLPEPVGVGILAKSGTQRLDSVRVASPALLELSLEAEQRTLLAAFGFGVLPGLGEMMLGAFHLAELEARPHQVEMGGAVKPSVLLTGGELQDFFQSVAGQSRPALVEAQGAQERVDVRLVLRTAERSRGVGGLPGAFEVAELVANGEDTG